MYKLQKCALCGKQKDIQLSHIVPKFIGRHLKGTSIGSVRSSGSGKVVQDLEKHYMLCHDCEEMFSASERWFSKNIFYPWLKDKTDTFNYTNRLFYFLTSLSWRSLYLDLLDFVENSICSVEELNCLIKAESVMKDFLLGNKSNIDDVEHHIFFFERIQTISSSREFFSYSPHAAIHRSVTSYTVCYKNGTLFTISNLMGIIVVTFYRKNDDEKWINTKINNGIGTLIAKNQNITSVVGNEMNYWLESAQKQYEHLSDKEKEKITKKLIDIGEDIKNYDIYQDFVDDMKLK